LESFQDTERRMTRRTGLNMWYNRMGITNVEPNTIAQLAVVGLMSDELEHIAVADFYWCTMLPHIALC
jgi:hypothetical protein